MNNQSNTSIESYRAKNQLAEACVQGKVQPDDSTLGPMKSAVSARLVTIITELPKPAAKQHFVSSQFNQ